MNRICCTVAFLLLGCTFAFSAELDNAPKAPVPDAPKLVASTPAKAVEAPSITFGFDQRIRNEDWNNALDMNSVTDDERRQMRYRTRAWVKYNSEPVDFVVGLVDEFYKKYALKPADVTADRLNMDEVVFDNLYVNFKKLPVHGLSLSFGRQDLQRGEGFILFDGTSGDGSRTAYFNSVDLAYQHKNSKFELLGILDPRQDRFLGIIHNQHKYLTEWDEQAIGLYYTNRDHKSSDVDAYYFYKKEVKDFRAPSNPQFQPNRNISTLGARTVQRFANGYSFTGEFAAQWGGQHANAATGAPAADIRAWGGYAYAKKSFSSGWKPYVLSGVWALSGDDPNKPRTLNGFDPLFSRWPKWSELYLYTLVPERGVAYWTNNKMFQVEAGLNPVAPLNIRATFYEEVALHPDLKNLKVFGTGTHRGESYQLRADYAINDKWKCHVLYENFVPGDFYKAQADSFFFQAQVMYRFTAKLVSFQSR